MHFATNLRHPKDVTNPSVSPNPAEDSPAFDGPSRANKLLSGPPHLLLKTFSACSPTRSQNAWPATGSSALERSAPRALKYPAMPRQEQLNSPNTNSLLWSSIGMKSAAQIRGSFDISRSSAFMTSGTDFNSMSLHC